MKPTEIRLVASMLERPADDAEDLAKQIIEALDAKRSKDDRFVAIYQWRPADEQIVTIAYGPYSTGRKATKAVASMVSPSEPLARAMILKCREVQT